MAYKRKTKDVWKLWWNGECIDTFDDYKEACRCRKEYEMAFSSYVELRAGREAI